MSLPFFYEPTVEASTQPFVLSASTSKHCIQVLRMRVSEYIQLTDGKGSLFKAKIISADKEKSVVILENVEKQNPPSQKISIGISLLKNPDRLEWLLEKITEIGIHHIYPLICKRTEQQRFKTERMQQILISGMLQSQQCWLPTLHEPQQLLPFLNNCSAEQKIIAHCEAEEKKFVTQIPKANETIILIGPEGDFTKEEIETALQLNFIPASLGETRLRTETAGLVAVTLLTHR